MDKARFRKRIHEIIKSVLDYLNITGNWMWRAIKPIVGMAVDKLDDAIEHEPKEVYKWLKIMKRYVDDAVKAYEEK